MVASSKNLRSPSPSSPSHNKECEQQFRQFIFYLGRLHKRHDEAMDALDYKPKGFTKNQVKEEILDMMKEMKDIMGKIKSCFRKVENNLKEDCRGQIQRRLGKCSDFIDLMSKEMVEFENWKSEEEKDEVRRISQSSENFEIDRKFLINLITGIVGDLEKTKIEEERRAQEEHADEHVLENGKENESKRQNRQLHLPVSQLQEPDFSPRSSPLPKKSRTETEEEPTKAFHPIRKEDEVNGPENDPLTPKTPDSQSFPQKAVDVLTPASSKPNNREEMKPLDSSFDEEKGLVEVEVDSSTHDIRTSSSAPIGNYPEFEPPSNQDLQDANAHLQCSPILTPRQKRVKPTLTEAKKRTINKASRSTKTDRKYVQSTSTAPIEEEESDGEDSILEESDQELDKENLDDDVRSDEDNSNAAFEGKLRKMLERKKAEKPVDPNRKRTLSEQMRNAETIGKIDGTLAANNRNAAQNSSDGNPAASRNLGRKRAVTGPTPSEPPKKQTAPLNKPSRKDSWIQALSYYSMLAFISILNALVKTEEQDDWHKKVISKVEKFSGFQQENLKREEIELEEEEELPDDGNYRLLGWFFQKMYVITSTNTDDQGQKTRMKDYTNGKRKRRDIAKDKMKVYGSQLCLRLSTQMFLDPVKSSGRKVIEAARKGIVYGRNDVYECPVKYEFPKSSNELVKKEHNAMKKKSMQQNDFEQGWLYIPTRVITAKRYNEKVIRKLSKCIPMTCIRGMTGVNLQKFLLDAVMDADKEKSIEVHRQIPQPCQVNVVSGRSTWKIQTLKENEKPAKIPLSEFKKYCDEPLEFVKSVLMNKNFEKEHFEEFKNLLRSFGNKKNEFKNFFGTNAEMPAEHEKDFGLYKEIAEEIKKLPKFLQPNMKNDLLESAHAKMSGLNHPQWYFKTPGVRTGCHIENSGLASVNLNAGPGISVWFAVPFEFAEKMEALLKKRSKENLYGAYWPLEEECRKAGIPVQVFYQKPGDTVYIAPGTFHWVQSLGYSAHISWNIGECTKTQLEMMAVMHDHQSINGDTGPVLPLQQIIWNMVKDNKKMEEGAESTLLNLFTRCLAFATMELEFLKEMGETSTQMTQEQVDKYSTDWMSCDFNGCHKKLYNLVAVRTFKKDQQKSYCLEHCYTDKDDNKPTFYHRHNLEEGADLMDKLKKKLPNQQ